MTPTLHRIQVRSTPAALVALYAVNIPDAVVRQIIGKEYDVSPSLEIEVEWLGVKTTWCLPPDAVRVVE